MPDRPTKQHYWDFFHNVGDAPNNIKTVSETDLIKLVKKGVINESTVVRSETRTGNRWVCAIDVPGLWKLMEQKKYSPSVIAVQESFLKSLVEGIWLMLGMGEGGPLGTLHGMLKPQTHADDFHRLSCGCLFLILVFSIVLTIFSNFRR